MLEFYNTYFDDPIDQNNISIGIEVYNKTHKSEFGILGEEVDFENVYVV